MPESNASPRTLEGTLQAKGMRFALVAGRFNEFFVDKLVEGALDSIRRHGGNPSDALLVRVPGAFEIPLAAQKLAEGGKHDAVICLGAVVRGATPHFDYVAGEAAKGISSVSLKTGVPCVFGIVTADSLEQALERCGTKQGNKGFDAATTAIEMVSLLKQLG